MIPEEQLMQDEEYPYQIMNSTMFKDYSTEFLQDYYSASKDWFFKTKHPEKMDVTRLNHLHAYLTELFEEEFRSKLKEDMRLN